MPPVLPAPAVSAATPAADRISNRFGYYTATISGQVNTTFTSNYDETTKLRYLPAFDCYAGTSGSASYTMRLSTADGGEYSLKISRRKPAVFTYVETTAQLDIYAPDSTKRTFVRSITVPPSTGNPDYGSGDLQVSADGSGGTFSMVMVERDANFDPIPSSTLTVTGNISCTYP